MLTRLFHLGVVHNCHNFHERTQRNLRVRVSRAAVRFFKMSFMVYCDFEKGSQNQHFQSTLLVVREGFTKKSTLCTLLIMLTIVDDPLRGQPFISRSGSINPSPQPGMCWLYQTAVRAMVL